MGKIYVTLRISEVYGVKKVAFECPTEDVALDIATRAASLVYVYYVRIRKCRKPTKRIILPYTDYKHLNLWYLYYNLC